MMNVLDTTSLLPEPFVRWFAAQGPANVRAQSRRKTTDANQPVAMAIMAVASP
jgi:hypothetical protein